MDSSEKQDECHGPLCEPPIGDSLDARALRAEKRNLQAHVEAFEPSLFSQDRNDGEKLVRQRFDQLKRELAELREKACRILPPEELQDMIERLDTLIGILTNKYQVWNDKTQESLRLHTNSPTIEPCDSASNLGSHTSSRCSLSASQLANEQIKLDLERERLKAQFESQKLQRQAKLELNLRLAEIKAKEKRLALSNHGSVVSRNSAGLQRPPASLPDLTREIRFPISLSTQPEKNPIVNPAPSRPQLEFEVQSTSRAAQLSPCTAALTEGTESDAHEPVHNKSRTVHSYNSTPSHLREITEGTQYVRPPDASTSTRHDQKISLTDIPRRRYLSTIGTATHRSGSDDIHRSARQTQVHTGKLSQCPPAARKAQFSKTNTTQYTPAHRHSSQNIFTTVGIPVSSAEPTSYGIQNPAYADAHMQQQLPTYHQPQSSPYGGDSQVSTQSYQLLLEEAREIRFTGRKLPFIFFYNQISQLLERCLDPNRKMDLLRASCQEQAREAISALVPPVPGWGVETQIERALDGLRLRYGCSSFLSEPLVKQIRSGSKFNKMDVHALEQLISELNDCELYARAYKQTEALNSSFIADIAERLPFYFKNRYMDYLLDHCDNLDDPSFATFKSFLRRELKRINTTFAQRILFTSHDKGAKTNTPQKVKVYQTSAEAQKTTTTSSYTTPRNLGFSANQRQLPKCFVCSTPNKEYRHLLSSCDKYKNMTVQVRHDSIIRAGYCINCLSSHHLKDCPHDCKCRHCGKQYPHKHTTSLHDLFHQSFPLASSAEATTSGTAAPNMGLGAASCQPLPSSSTADQSIKTNVMQVEVQRLGVLTRVSAVRVTNPYTGASSLVYAQHDPGSQVTLISTSLVESLGLKTKEKSHLTLHTLSSSQTGHYSRVGFNLEAVHTSECFSGLSAIVVPPWSESGNNLPHNQDLSSYSHFKGVSTFVLPHNSSVDILVGLDNSQLMTVLEERVGEIDQPHAIMTPLGWIASGGNVRSDTHEVTARKVSVSPIFDDKDLKILKLQETIRILAADNETTQLSLSDRKAQRMVEDNIEVCENRYRIPVPLKEHAINLPNNFELAAKRLDFLRKRMTKNPDIADKVIQSMKELKQSGYIVPAGAERKRLLNYLPYFLTEQTKPRVVYDGSATWSKQCVNDVIYSGPDGLNVLSHVFARFRMGKYALMADLSKCFLQILLPEEQQDLFRILWYKEDDITKGEIEEFKFTRHVWGVISSPYIACRAMRKVTEENPTQASTLTVKAIQRSMYMDDFLVSSDTLEDAEVIASESINLFKSRGFQLVKWSANKAAKSVIAELDEGNLAPVIRTIDLTKDDPLPNFKAVGCIWDAEHDSLRMQLHLDQPDVYTRRTMLSQISRQYDPLGYLAPLVLKGRLILQQMAIDEFSWDEVVDPRDKKAWGLLFSCMASRAVHVELVTSLDLSSFILAFSRFVDVRGPVSGFHSDNGSTFKAAAHILPDLLSSDDLQSFFRQKGISWEFIPPYSPAQGGAWESLVKVFKKTLLQVASSSHRTPNLMELQTYVSNTTYLVNNRPLTSTSDDPRDHTAITPASLLTPYFHPHTPIGTPHDKDHLRRDYRFNVGIAQRFWQRWIRYYLPQLQKRKKWFKCVDNLKVGQLVLVGSHGEFNKRGQYRMGRVTEVLPQIRKGKAIVRRAVVAVNSTSSSSQASESELTLIERDISKLAPLELAD